MTESTEPELKNCDFILGGAQGHTCNSMTRDPSGLCYVHRQMPGAKLRDLMGDPERGCECSRIMAKDKTRHFKECPLREKYPDEPLGRRPQKVEEVLFEAREVISDYLDGSRGIALSKAALATIDHIDKLKGR